MFNGVISCIRVTYCSLPCFNVFFFTNTCTGFFFTDIHYQYTIFFIECLRRKGQMLHLKTELQTEITLKSSTQKYSLRKGSAKFTFLSSYNIFVLVYTFLVISFSLDSFSRLRLFFPFSFKYHASLFCEIGLNSLFSISPHFFLFKPPETIAKR